jgi:hypothetical protein
LRSIQDETELSHSIRAKRNQKKAGFWTGEFPVGPLGESANTPEKVEGQFDIVAANLPHQMAAYSCLLHQIYPLPQTLPKNLRGEDAQMNAMKILGLTAATLGVVLAANTEVRGADAHSLKLTRPMVVAGVDLQAAVYTVQWDLQGTRATVRFSRKGRVVATVQGECTTLGRSVPGDTLYFSKRPEGYFAIMALGFAGSDKGIIFPLVRTHPRSPQDTPAGDLLMEESWRSAPQPRPPISK